MGASVDLNVPEDASLDTFDSDESADAESTDSASKTEADRKSNSDKQTPDKPTSNESDADEPYPNDSTPVDPAVSTFDWSPEGGECADCGESAERRWRAEGERGGSLVCADCKQW